MISLFTLKVFQNSLMLIFSYVKKEKLNQWNAFNTFMTLPIDMKAYQLNVFIN